MEVITNINDIREKVTEWKKQNLTIGFVPTMGALHIGHESLIKKARQECDKVVVSIFVNPIQFGPKEDYNCYPRNLDNDESICLSNQVDIIFAPTVSQMYPDYGISEGVNSVNFDKMLTKVCPPEPYVNKLCGKSRAGHFDGVATVVLKLFNIVQPDIAFFGQKDAQQLIILKKMCKDLNVPVNIISCPIIRDKDGLACSSRNAYLSEESRTKALSLNKVLKNAEKLYKNGVREKTHIIEESLKVLNKDAQLDYFEIYDAETLQPLDTLKANSLIAIAARIGNVRLIDNIIVT